MQWINMVILMILAMTINTVFIHKLVAAINDVMADFVFITIHKKNGWNIAVAASAFGIASSVSFIIMYSALKWKTNNNHQNLTNKELMWKKMLEENNTIEYINPYGPKIEFKNQMKYKRERIGPATWLLPIILCILACGFALLANVYPRFNINKEPRDTFRKHFGKITTKIKHFDNKMDYMNITASKECFPFPTLYDLIRSNPNFAHLKENFLMFPIQNFRKLVNHPLDKLKIKMKMATKKLIGNITENLVSQDVLTKINNISNVDFKFLGLILLIPRLIAIFILLFGMITMSIAMCQMKIIPSIEPKKIIKIFGKVCMFSIILVHGTQLAICNFLSNLPVPFMNISCTFGLGYTYDILCETIMISIWIGMNNEYFFAIPCKKKIVTYSIPGISDSGNSEQNKIY